MKSILIDSDVVLDVTFERLPFAEASLGVMEWAGMNSQKACLAYHSVANIFYLARKSFGREKTVKIIQELLKFMRVVGASAAQIVKIMEFEINDFEDALQVAAAQTGAVGYIVTRNLKHYKKSPVKAISPVQFLAMQ